MSFCVLAIIAALHAIQGSISHEISIHLSVCLSVCLSVKRVNCDKKKETSAEILTPYKGTFI